MALIQLPTVELAMEALVVSLICLVWAVRG